MSSESLQNKRILVFGRDGQIGRALAQHAGSSWVFAGRDMADLSDPEALGHMLAQQNWHAVINAAAYTDVDRAEGEEALAHIINADAPGRMARYCAERKIPFAHISTDYVFDGNRITPAPEDHPTNPLNAYGRSKLAGEDAVLDAGGRAIILRTSWIYSAGGDNFVRRMLDLGRKNDTLSVVDDQTGSPTAAADFASGLIALLPRLIDGTDASETGVFHMTAAGETSRYAFAKAIFAAAEALGAKVPSTLTPVPSTHFPTPALRPAHSTLNCTKLGLVYGVTLPDWHTGLPATIKSMLSASCTDSAT